VSVPSAISSAGFEAGANANAFAEYLSCNRWRVVVECIQDAELEPVSADAVGKTVVELFLRDGRLPHAKAAKRSCRDDIGMYGASERAVVRDLIGPEACTGTRPATARRCPLSEVVYEAQRFVQE